MVPHLAHIRRHLQAIATHILRKAQRRGLVLVVIAAVLAQIHHDAHGVGIAPVGELNHQIAVGACALALIRRVDDDGAVQPRQLLHGRMRVIPISAVLLHFEAVGKGLARFDASKADTGHTIHLIRQQNPVPVDRAIFSQQVFYADGNDIALAPAQRGARQAAID